MTDIRETLFHIVLNCSVYISNNLKARTVSYATAKDKDSDLTIIVA